MQSRISAHELGDSRRCHLPELSPLDLPLEAESSLHSQVDELTSKLDCVEQEKRSSLSRQRILEGDIRALRERWVGLSHLGSQAATKGGVCVYRVYLLEDQVSEAQRALERERQEQERQRAEELVRVGIVFPCVSSLAV